jgi:hypothetical protein
MSDRNSNGLAAANNQPAKLQTTTAPHNDFTIELLAKSGHHVSSSSNGDFTVSKYGHWAHCEDLDALKAFARKVGVLK